MIFDVLVIGFGPGGEAAASLISQAGFRVLAVDKALAPYGQPRMSAIDGEIARILQHAADPKEAMAESVPSKVLLRFGADGQALPPVDLNYKICGHWKALSLHQPNIEAAMERRIAQAPSAQYRWGWRASAIRQDPDKVCVELTSVEDPRRTETVEARYVLGFDGASSFVREAVGIEVEVLHKHDDRWILTDFDVLRPIPDIAMTAQFRMDPVRPWFAGGNGANRCRTDMRVLPEEDLDALVADQDNGYAFSQAKFGLTREDIRMTRRVGYRFRSQVAKTFRKGRVFIGGDAAHAMTPYMGQGACCAMRDAANIAWKLRMVLSGAADASLLDSYEAERMPHSLFFVNGSLATLKHVDERDPQKAAARDAAVRSGQVKFPAVPGLVAGLLHRLPTGELAPHAGRLAPQGVVRRGRDEGLLDDLVGYGPQLISRLPMASLLSDGQRQRLGELGVHVLHVADSAGADLVDVDGTYRDFWQDTQASTLLARADHYLFGVADGDAATRALVDDFLAQIPLAGRDAAPAQALAAA